MTRQPGHHARHLTVGTLAYQVAQFTAVAAGLVVTTLLGRRLTLGAFGVYGLVLSFSLYLAFLQGAVITAVVRRLPAATSRSERDRVLSASFVVFGLVGLIAAVVIAGVGSVLLTVLQIPPGLEHQGRLGVVALSAAALIGWPLRIFSEILRANQWFRAAALSETAAYATWGVLMVGMVVLFDAPLWMLIGWTGSIPMLIGLAGLAIVIAGRVRWWPRRRAVGRGYLRGYLVEVMHLATQTASGTLASAAARGILAFFTNPAAVGLYESTVRPSNLIRQVHGSLIRTVVPASARYHAEGDVERTRALLLRGTRYVLAASLPVIVTLVVLSQPILGVWLGERFETAALAMSILVGAQLFEASKAVAGSMLLAAGKVRALAIYAWSMASLQLVLAVVLTRLFGLEGLVTAFTVGALALYPVMLRMIVSTFPVTVRELAVEAFMRPYLLALALAAALVAIRLLVPLAGAPVVIVACAGVVAYWVLFYALWVHREERALIRGLMSVRSRATSAPVAGVEQ